MSARILILGGGYAGRIAAARLARAGHRVILVDARGQNVQRIALHLHAVRGASVTRPLAPPLERAGVQVVRGRAVEVREGEVRLQDGRRLAGDRVVLALGSRTRPLADSQDVHEIGNLEGAARLRASLEELRGGRVVVVGGGLTGLELASELGLRRPDLQVHLMAATALDQAFSASGASRIRTRLGATGVILHQGVRATAADGAGVQSSAGPLRADRVVCCAGMEAPELARDSGLPVDASGRVWVGPDLRVEGTEGLFAAGDAARVRSLAWLGRACATALPMGAHVAATVDADLRGASPPPFAFAYMLRCVQLGGGAALVQRTDARGRPTWSLGGPLAGLTKQLLYRYVQDVPALEARLGRSLYTWPATVQAGHPDAEREAA